jgi:hypothetical protein
MDIDIEGVNPTFPQENSPLSKPNELGFEKPLLSNDVLEKNLLQSTLLATDPKVPALEHPIVDLQLLDAITKELMQSLSLPNGQELVAKLTPDLKAQVRKLKFEPELAETFKSLLSLVPLGVAYLAKVGVETNGNHLASQYLNEVVSLFKNLANDPLLSENQREEFKSIDIVDRKGSAPPMYLEPMISIKPNTTSSKETFTPLSFSDQLIEFLQIDTSPLGPHLKKFAKGFAILGESLFSGILSDKSLVDLRHVFEKGVIAALFLSNGLTLAISKKKQNEDEYKDLVEVSFKAIEELKVLDQIPFSFMAFFVPFQREGFGSKSAKKDAYEKLIQLIRLLIKLAVVLVCLFDCGRKLGKSGVKWMIGENKELLFGIFNDLVFALKKAQEVFGVNTAPALASLQKAKDGLIADDLVLFWEGIQSLIQKNCPLATFLKEFDAADPIFNVFLKNHS